MYARFIQGAGIRLTVLFVEMCIYMMDAYCKKVRDLRRSAWMKKRLKDFYTIIKNHKK